MTPDSVNQALDQLEGLHLPEGVSQWPLAPGWIICALLLLAIIIFSSRFIYRQLKKNRYRRQATKKLSVLFTDYSQHNNDKELLAQVNGLLKAVAIKRYSAQQCAGLSGSQWLRFLERSCEKNKAIDNKVFAHLGNIYSADVTINAEQRQQLLSTATLWLKKHHDLENKERSSV